jgi:hypothetical protein
MERLKIVLIIAAMVATARTSPGQQATRSSSSNADHAQPTFVVIGDVRNHNYFVLSPHARTTIHQAVIQAGMLGDSVSVSVLRGKQQRAAFTQMVSHNKKTIHVKVLCFTSISNNTDTACLI